MRCLSHIILWHYSETIVRITGGMKVKADRDEVCLPMLVECALLTCHSRRRTLLCLPPRTLLSV